MTNTENKENKTATASENATKNENTELEKGEENTEEQKTPRKPSEIIFIPVKNLTPTPPDKTVDIPAKTNTTPPEGTVELPAKR